MYIFFSDWASPSPLRGIILVASKACCLHIGVLPQASYESLENGEVINSKGN